MTEHDTYIASCKELQRLYHKCQPPNGHQPQEFGDKYAGIFENIFSAYRRANSIDEMRETINTMRCVDPGIEAMLAEPLPTERIFSARELLTQEMPPVRWAVPGILPEGVMLLCGKPKMGKSWLSLGIAISLASGGMALGSIPVEKSDVLYLALEDQRRRLKKRTEKLLPDGSIPDGLDFAIEWPRLQENGLEQLSVWLELHPNAKLVIIDTLEKIRPRRNDKGGNAYADDYSAVAGLSALADKYHVAILIVHHLRKAEAEDPFDMISGSTGLTGAVDGAMVLMRTRGQADAVLFIDGRDLDDTKELALHWDAQYALWSILGTADEFRMSQERQAIVNEVKIAQGSISLKDLVQALDKPYNNVRKVVADMLGDGQLKQVSKGVYALP